MLRSSYLINFLSDSALAAFTPTKEHIRSSLHQLETPVETKGNLLNAAISMVFYAKNGQFNDWQDLELLFMQRAEHPKDPWSGSYSQRQLFWCAISP